MLVLQVYAPEHVVPDVLAVLARRPEVSHVVRGGVTEAEGTVLVTADVDSGVVDTLLPDLAATGVPGDDIVVVHRDANRPLGSLRADDVPSWSGGALAWSELAMASRHYTRAVPQFLTFMACSGIIAAFGVLTRTSTLVVGAMAISPDLLPICATCVGLVSGRRRLASRAFLALTVGLGVAALSAFLVTAVLRAGGYAPALAAIGNGGLGSLPRLSIATVVVAFVAGIAGILAFETRAGAAVGVAISVTTIPAAAYLGTSLALRDPGSAGSGLVVLAVNVAMLVLAGSLTLLVQRRLRQRSAAATFT
jgi:uncharacterized hydrophobic protein (TIGR00271 family)